VDPDARLKLHALLEQLRADGVGVLLTTHDLDEAERLCDRIGLLVDGRLQAEGSLTELLREALGADKHLELALREPPPDDARAGLSALGLEPSRDPSRWIGRRAEGAGTLGGVERAVRDLGLALRQVTLVEPGLREVFLHVTGRELDR
jgi:ABC-2 type transport system ATP-binding protein